MTGVSKGYIMEEKLGQYFKRSGYFVVRGLSYQYSGFDITDIDLWLYNRTSVSKRTTIVDIKNKKTPQAIERIFWTLGLKNAVNADEAIVATTDRRKEVVKFGEKLGILVLDGSFIKRIMDSKSFDEEHISEEQLYNRIKEYNFQKLDGDWIQRIESSKRVLLNDLGFDGLAELMTHGRYFASQVIANTIHREISLRLLYRIMAYICICFDVAMETIAFSEEEDRKEIIREGILYGDKNKSSLNKAMKDAKLLIENFLPNGSGVFHELSSNMDSALSSNNIKILVDYFYRPAVIASLFSSAKYYDWLCTKSEFICIPELIEAKSTLYILLDYWRIDRKEFESSAANTSKQ